MRVAISALQNFAIAFTFLSIFSLDYFKKIVDPDDKRNKYKRGIDRLSNAYILNLAVFTTFSFGAAYLGFSVKNTYILILIVAALSLLVRRKSSFSKSDVFVNLSLLGTSATVALWACLPAISKSIKMGSGLNMPTIGNNDVVSYAATATEFLKTGFTNSNHLANMDLNAFSRDWQHEVPNLLTSFVAFTFRLQPWQIMNSIVMIAIGLAFLATMKLLMEVVPSLTIKSCIIGSSIVALSPMMIYIFGNNFIGQSYSVSIASLTLSKVIEVSKNTKISRYNFILIACLTILAIYAYPVFLIPFLGICGTLYFVLAYIFKTSVKKENILKLLCSVSIGVLISLPYFGISIRILKALSNIASGWPLPFLTPQVMLISGRGLGFNFTNFWLVISWIIPIIVWILWVIKSSLTKIEKNTVIFLSIFFIMIVSIVLIIKRDPINSYQTWKLMSYFLPLVYPVILASVINRKFLGKVTTAILLCAGLIAPTLQWQTASALDDLAVSREMQEVAQHPLIKAQKNLNLDLKPYYESMAMAVILQRQEISINSQQYFPITQNPDACTLIRRDNRNYLKAKPINTVYSLVPSQSNSCQIKDLNLTYSQTTFGVKYFFSKGSNGVTQLIDGWASPEPWGTWSDGTSAKLGVILPLDNKPEVTILIKGNVHVPLKAKELKIEYFINGKTLLEKTFTQENISSDTLLKFPAEWVEKNRVVLIEFKIMNPVSPKDDGLSPDPRAIGFGIVSLEISR